MQCDFESDKKQARATTKNRKCECLWYKPHIIWLYDKKVNWDRIMDVTHKLTQNRLEVKVSGFLWLTDSSQTNSSTQVIQFSGRDEESACFCFHVIRILQEKSENDRNKDKKKSCSVSDSLPKSRTSILGIHVLINIRASVPNTSLDICLIQSEKTKKNNQLLGINMWELKRKTNS